MSLEPSSSAPAREVGAGYWEAPEEAAARLAAMTAAGRVEEELSEEQFQGNNQIQEDELLALQAIYGDDMAKFDNMDGLRFFQVYMNIRANGTTAETGDEDDANDGLLYACSLQHLPPITLTCLLPRSYPSARAPYFIVSATWLDEPEVSAFCSILDEIWAELPGQEVVYIASDGQMVLDPDVAGSSAGSDERAIGRSGILDSTIPMMQRYSEERSQEMFDQSIHGNFIQLPCSHSFCVKCMESYCSIHVKDGSVAMLACPDTSYRAPLAPAVLRRLLAEEGYARWESLALRRTLDTMPDVAYCPRCNAACVAAGDDAQCAACFFTFCAQCGDRRHVGGPCIPTEQKVEDLLKQTLKPSAREQWSSQAQQQQLSERRKLEELLSLREVLRSTMQCPSCRMAIAKTQGCNKMVCYSCGQFFCYRCGRAITGYLHFANGECGLFERVRRRNGNQHLELDVDDNIQEPGWVRALRYKCPACGAKQAKAGANNLLVCRTCNSRYCALCWKRVWEPAEHNGLWGDCQQRG
ncbi:hypothetical protein BS78_04G231300 [Paspalum vaginatum]|nr:hypothetical protein BS78_04G231300 [Paspalum vaginatum]